MRWKYLPSQKNLFRTNEWETLPLTFQYGTTQVRQCRFEDGLENRRDVQQHVIEGREEACRFSFGDQAERFMYIVIVESSEVAKAQELLPVLRYRLLIM